MKITTLLSLLLFTAINYSLASTNKLIIEANNQKLYEKKTWKKLLHFSTSNFLFTKSDIISNDFFLSKDGNTNPQSELDATIKGYFSPVQKDPNNHPKCKYPARYLWLKKHMNLDKYKSPDLACSNYNIWRNSQPVNSISLLFVSGYLSNPSSFYGHLLLKFNQSKSDLLNTTINYGAIIPPKEFPITYMTKGVLGGYKATYSDQKFYRYNHNYTENDLRNIWDYELKLNHEDMQFLVAHTWELMGQKFTYYFFRDNCAYRVAKLLELIIDEPLIPQHIPWALPYHVVDRVNTTKKPLVKAIRFIPSKQVKFIKKYHELPNHLKQIFDEIIYKKIPFQSKSYSLLSINQKIMLLDALTDYSSFLITKFKKNKAYTTLKQKTLFERIKLPIKNNKFKTKEVPIHKSQKPSLIQLTTFQNKGIDAGLSIRLRAANYDILSLDEGRIPNSTVEMFDIQFSSSKEATQLDYLTFINIFALNNSITNLPGDGGLTWKLHVAIENQSSYSKPSHVFFSDFGLGKSNRINKSTDIYGLLTARFQTGPRSLALIPTIGLIKNISKAWKLHIQLGSIHYSKGSSTPIILIEQRFGKLLTKDIRLTYKKSFNQEIRIGQSFYW